MKKLISVLLAVCMVFSMLTVAAVSVGAADVQAPSTGAGTVLTLKPNSDWLSANARFAAYFFGNGEKWENMTADSTGTVYTVTAPEGYSNVIFCRMNPATTANNWNNKWNQTSDLKVSDGVGNAYVITGWDNSGKWTTYTAPTEPVTEAPVTFANHFTVDITQVMNQESGTWYIWTWDDTHEGTWRPIEKFGYVAAHDKALFACINGDVSWDNAVAQTVDFDVENDGSLLILNEKEEGKYKVQWKGDEPATEAPATEPATDAPVTDAPAKLADGFYLIGDNWTIDAIDAADKFTANENAEGEYFLETTLAEKDEFKVVKVENDTITAWYPDGTDNNYVVDKAHAGDVTIYFQETYKADWADFGGYFYIAVPEAPTDAPATDAPATDAPATDAPATDAPADVDYYLFGYINGANYACEEDADNMGEYKFADGTLTATFEENSYVAVKTTGNANWYMTKGWQGTDVTSATLYNTTALGTDADKLFVPGGVEVTFTLTAGEGDTFTLSYTTKGEPATEAPATEPATDAPVTDAPVTEPATDAPADVDYYLFGYINGANYACEDDADNMGEYKFADGTLTATFEENSYVAVKTTGNANWYMTKGWQGTEVTSATLYNTTALGTDADKLYVPGGVEVTFTLTAGEGDTFILSYTTKGEPATEAPATEPATDAPVTDAPAKLADGFYLIGDNWTIDAIDAADKFTANENAEGEYFLETTLAEKDEFKVVKVENDTITAWYPDGTDNNYVVDKAHAGDVTIYFQETYKADWADFGGYFYIAVPEAPTDAPATDAPATDAPATDAPATDAPADVDYYLFGYINGANYACEEDADNMGEYKFTDGTLTATFEKDSYVAVKTTGNANWYMTKGWQGTDVTSATLYNTTALGTDADKLFVPGGVEVTFTLTAGEGDTFTLSYTTKGEPATEAPATEPATDAPATDAPATDAPAKLADGFYLIGDDWTVDAIDAADKFTANENAEGEYFLETTLAEKDEFKVVKVENDTITAWYPDGTDNNYVVDKAHSGDVTIYFQETYKADWVDFGGYFYVAAPEAPTDAPATDAPATDAPATDAPATDAPADVDYYLFGYINGANYACEDDADNMGEYKFADGTLTATFEKDSYVAVKTTGNANWYMTDSWQGTDVTSATLYNTTALGTDADKLFVPGGVEVTFTLTAGEGDTFTLSYTTKGEPATEAPATDAPATDAPVTDAPVTDAPAKLADGFYLIGDDWTVDAIDAADKFTANENAEGEYFLETTLAEKDEFKVVKVENDTITAWYPDGIDNNYVVDKAHSGDVTIYFQETYKADWADFGGYFYVAVPEAPTDAPATDAPATDAPTTDAPADVDYYLFGYINGANYACEDDADNMGEYKFADGTLTATFEEDSYVAVKTTGNANWYMTDGWQGTDVTSATLYNTTALGTDADKLFVPGGVEVTFTLTADEGDTFTLSYTTKGEPATEAPATEPATDAPVTEPATDAPADVDYYLFGYINGANYACEEDADNMGEYKFADGTLTATFEADSYVAVKTTGNANWYMTDGWQGTDVTSATLYNTTALGTDADKLFVPGGVEVTFTLTAGEGDTFILSYTTKGEPVEVKYDLNGDGRFSIDDATLLQRYLAEFETLSAKQLVIADVNEDGKVNVHDLTDMQRLLAGF